MQIKIGIWFHRGDKQIISAYVKQIICEGILFWWKFKYKKRLQFTKTCITRTEILIVSFLMYVFLYHPWIADSEDRSLATLFSTQMRG